MNHMKQARICIIFLSLITVFWLFEGMLPSGAKKNGLINLLMIIVFSMLTIIIYKCICFIEKSLVNKYIKEYQEKLISIRHDVRTPITGIYRVALKVHDRLEDKELRELMRMIINASHEISVRVKNDDALE